MGKKTEEENDACNALYDPYHMGGRSLRTRHRQLSSIHHRRCAFCGACPRMDFVGEQKAEELQKPMADDVQILNIGPGRATSAHSCRHRKLRMSKSWFGLLTLSIRRRAGSRMGRFVVGGIFPLTRTIVLCTTVSEIYVS